jgi:hypothetical protein
MCPRFPAPAVYYCHPSFLAAFILCNTTSSSNLLVSTSSLLPPPRGQINNALSGGCLLNMSRPTINGFYLPLQERPDRTNIFFSDHEHAAPRQVSWRYYWLIKER